MNILITGISKGLGLKTTETFLEQGHVVFGISRSKTDELEKLLKKYPKSLNWFSYDLSDTRNAIVSDTD